MSNGRWAPTKLTRGLRADQRAAIPPFHAVRAFEAIVTCGGIRRAAETLSVDHATVSRHLRALENWLGVALIDRSPGSGGRLTPSGERYYSRLSDALGRISDASLEILKGVDDTQLSLVCAPGLASEWLTGRIGEFAAIAPHVAIELKPMQAEPDSSAYEVDLYIQYVPDASSIDPDPTMRSVEIARPPILAVASPDFIARSGQPGCPADLLKLPLLHEASYDQWDRWFIQHDVDGCPPHTGPKFWHNHLTLAAARRGQGIALANALLAIDDLQRGSLVALGAWEPVYLGSYQLAARRNRWNEPTITAFRRWLQNAVRAEPWVGLRRQESMRRG